MVTFSNLDWLQIFALIIILFSVVKVFVLIIKPKVWIEFVEWVYSGNVISMIIFVILSIFVLFKLQSLGVTFTQILAVTLFIALVSGVSLSIYAKEFMPFAKKLVKDKKFWRKAWVPTVIWGFLILMALAEIYFSWINGY